MVAVAVRYDNLIDIFRGKAGFVQRGGQAAARFRGVGPGVNQSHRLGLQQVHVYRTDRERRRQSQPLPGELLRFVSRLSKIIFA
ncbi:MAG: hypothetical protein ACYCXI_09790 [Dethiobacteraceae bacterium]